MELIQKKCLPCEGGITPLSTLESQTLLRQIPGWNIVGHQIHKKFHWKDFAQAMEFIQAMAEIAETENHHPDFSLHYNEVEVRLWTHAIDGLSENDFIVAAKINRWSPQ